MYIFIFISIVNSYYIGIVITSREKLILKLFVAAHGDGRRSQAMGCNWNPSSNDQLFYDIVQKIEFIMDISGYHDITMIFFIYYYDIIISLLNQSILL